MSSVTKPRPVNALRLAVAEWWISVRQYLRRDPSYAVWRRNIALSKSFDRIVTTADYVAALEHVEYVHALHRTDLETPKSRRKAKIYNKSVSAKIALEDSLAAVLCTPAFCLQCLREFAAIVGHTGVLDSESVVFDVSNPRYIVSDCLRTCVSAFTVGMHRHRSRPVMQMPRWAYDALSGILAAEATACAAEESKYVCTDARGYHLTTLGSSSAAPSLVHLESALALWRDADMDSLYHEFSAALIAASLV